MGTLQVQQLNLAFGDRDILSDVSFVLSEKSRAALAGGNGAGKTTLMKIIAGLIPCDSGSITTMRGMRISYLPQSDIVFGNRSVEAEVELGYGRCLALLDRQTELETLLATASEAQNYRHLTEELHEIQESLELSGYYRRAGVIDQVLIGLGFSRTDFTRSCKEFSGGWQMRIALAKILVEAPDIMFLDEPTNYLDIEALYWLKNYLKQFPGGLMLVCHDKFFLDETVNEVYELFNGTLTRYSGNYSSYERQREEELQQLEHAYELQQAEIERTTRFIERFRYKDSKSKQVQSRVKMLEKLEPVVVPSHLKKLSFSFPPAPHSGNDVVIVNQLSKCYGSHQVINKLSFLVNKGERLAVTGKNGAGKSTLLRIIAGIDSDYFGSVRTGAGVKVGYFAQDIEHTLNPSYSVFEEAESVADTADIPRLRSLLGSFLFSGDDIHKPVSVLSGGERSRLALMKILLHPANLLILDEPTNHLDINAKEMLLAALKAYQGTLIFVSHDSYFIEHIATKILYLSEQAPEFFDGDYQYFSWKLEQKEAVEQKIEVKKTQTVIQDAAQKRKEENRKKNRIRILKQESESLLIACSNAEAEIQKTEMAMGLEENYTKSEHMVALKRKKEELLATHEELNAKWFAVEEELQSLEAESV